MKTDKNHFSGTRLYTRQVFGLIVVFMTMGIAFVALSNLLSRHDADIVSQSVNRDLAQQILSDNPLVVDGQIEDGLVAESFDRFMRINPSIEVYLIDLDGTIRNFSADPKKVKRRGIDVQPIHEFLRLPAKFPILGDDPRDYGKKKVFSVTPVTSNDEMLGYLYVVLRGENVDVVQEDINRSRIARSTALALGLSLLTGLVTSLLLFRLLGRRLSNLTDRIAAFEQTPITSTDSEFLTTPPPKDEVELLETTFVSMSTRIREQLRHMSVTDDTRRSLIARVSHDLRTPLAVLGTHIESLQARYDKLSDADRQKHINTARREVIHLSTMVDDLFELSRLEASERAIERESMCLSDLLQDVVDKHQLAASEKNVGLSIDMTDELVWIKGDARTIERLLDNIVTNAIQHSPPAKSVSVGLRTVNDDVEITVSDRGPGIPLEDREHIFEPFYRTEHGDKTGTGLGLAIAHRITLLHDGKIRVGDSVQGARIEIILPQYHPTN